MKKPKKTNPFSRLSKAAKRVAICKDAIIQIKKGQFEIQTGVWACILDDEEAVNQKSLLGIRPPVKCSCCAIGAAFLSSMRLFNVAKFNNGASQTDAFDQLERYFSNDQLRLIEEAFEQAGGSCSTESEKSVDFGEKYKSDTKRAVAIFSNIVRNKGTFIP